MIEARGLTKRYGRVVAVDTLSFGKLGLPASGTGNRRVLAVLRYLGG